jgi:hypothetical protein
MTGPSLPLHPLLRVQMPAWPEPPEDGDRATGRVIIWACALGTLFWVALIAAWVWLRWTS